MKIHLVVNVQSHLLIVFYPSSKGWQFRVVTVSGKVMGEHALFYSCEAAEKAGRNCLGGERCQY